MILEIYEQNKLININENVINLTISTDEVRTIEILTGKQGAPGIGLPNGGTIGQLLAKKTNAEGVTEWINQSDISITESQISDFGNYLDKTLDTTDDLTEGTTNIYFTNDRAKSALSGMYEVPLTFSSGLLRTVNSVTNTDKGSSAVSSHNLAYDHTLIATALQDLSALTTDDLTEGSTHLYDKPVSLTEGANIGISGTYPNFTIAYTGTAGTNDKVKYDANDPTAGYIIDKFKSGTGITLSEGTGANENKLIITNNDTGTSVINAHNITYDHSLISSALQSVDWDEIGGTQTDISLSGFTDDLSYEEPLTFSTGLTRTTNTITVNESEINTSGLNNDEGFITGIDSDDVTTALGFTPEDSANKAQNNGYASLDSGGKVPLSQLPNSLLVYKGVWNATTNTPTLTTPDVDKKGYVYICNVAGTQFGITFHVGDWAIYNDSGVIEKSDNSDEVVSVNGQTGIVVIDADDIDDTSTTNKFVTSTQKSNWDTAYGWGDHAGLYDTTGTASGLIGTHESTYAHDLITTALQSETDPVFSASQASNITADDITNLSNLSGTNTGDQTLPTRDSLGLDTDDIVTFANLSGTNTGDSANVTKTLTAGENLVAGNVCYLKADGKMWKAKGDAEVTTKGKIAMALASITANTTGSFLVDGDYTTSGLTAGATYFISTSTAGAVTSTTPTTGNFIRIIGVAISTTVLNFNPSQDYGEVA